MATMIFADEVLPPDRIDEIGEAEDVKTTKRELEIAEQLVESLAGDFEPERFHDAYREQVLAMIERKAQGEEIAVQPAARGGGNAGARPDERAEGEPRGRQGPRGRGRRQAESQTQGAGESRGQESGRQESAQIGRRQVRLGRETSHRETLTNRRWRRGMPRKLGRYARKRDFERTPEPAPRRGARRRAAELPRFVIHQHSARRLHWDLRLEHDGALASWAVPKGMPEAPGENRFAAATEDHPLEYLDFQGEIPKGHYGAGKMTIWDQGTYELPEVGAAQDRGALHGERLNARYALFPIDKEDPPRTG